MDGIRGRNSRDRSTIQGRNSVSCLTVEDTPMARGRKPSVRYWESRGGFCAWVNGRRELLAKGPDDAPKGETYLAALDRFKKLLALEADKGTDEYLVSSLLNQYRMHLKSTRKSAVPGVFEVMARG